MSDDFQDIQQIKERLSDDMLSGAARGDSCQLRCVAPCCAPDMMTDRALSVLSPHRSKKGVSSSRTYAKARCL
eukprot:2472474-Pleurochrysis_carterae.AAC.2